MSRLTDIIKQPFTDVRLAAYQLLKVECVMGNVGDKMLFLLGS